MRGWRERIPLKGRKRKLKSLSETEREIQSLGEGRTWARGGAATFLQNMERVGGAAGGEEK